MVLNLQASVKCSVRLQLLKFIAFAMPAIGLCQVSDTPAFTDSSKEIELATQQLKKVEELVELGAESRVRLEEAKKNLADTQDAATVEQMRYIPVTDLTEQRLNEIVSAAQRRLDRINERIALRKKLNAIGVGALSELTVLEEQLRNRQLDLDSAVSRAQLGVEAIALEELNASISYAQPPTLPMQSAFSPQGMERFDGVSAFDEARDLKPLLMAFETEFDRPLPISVDGESELHRELGFDHRGRVDVAVNPGSPEGVWLREYLQEHRLPYYAFLQRIPGKATAAHIHIGPASTRLVTFSPNPPAALSSKENSYKRGAGD